MSTLAFVFGCRDPNSKYARDGAFVVARLRGNTDIILAEFHNGADYIGHTTSVHEMIETYDFFLKRGWVPMDVDDLDNTAIDKEDIDEYTILGYSRLQNCVGHPLRTATTDSRCANCT